MNTLAGDSQRNSIAQLLAMKFREVELEKRLTATTADVFFVDDTNHIFPRKIAIESKDWAKRLSSDDLARIYNLYSPSLSTREIDYLWIIGKHPLSSSPKVTLDSLPNVRYSHFDEFRASLMNFTGLLHNNIHLFDHHEASAYFVHTRTRNNNQTLYDYVLNWVESQPTGLMVYGGYGLGKTTFSYYLASELSRVYLRGDFDRIPIRISLGGMYSKQDLIALICSALSGGEGGVSVKDFSYGLFLEMNRQGQYLLILDGFDEMRHAMELDDFVYTFEQMKPLFVDSAKIIILGRPESFLSTQEEDEVLSSLFEGDKGRSGGLQTVEVAFFTKNEIEGYLESFISRRSEKLSPKQLSNYRSLMSKLPDSEDSILSRPVQLKMFTRVIDECLATDTLINRYQLYSKFIYSFIIRESRKPARQPTEGVNRKDLQDDRATFMQATAWWVLNTKKENRFLADEIPTELIPPNIRAGRGSTAAMREAIVGSIIEPISQSGVLGNKAKKYYYFPHKSYLEFLIANYFERNRFTIDIYRECMRNLNNEILIFLEEGPAGGVEHLRQGLMHNLGTVDARVIEVCATDKAVEKEAREQKRGNRHATHIYTHYFFLRKNRPQDVSPYLIARLTDSVVLESALAAYTCVVNELGSQNGEELARAIILNCMTGVSVHGIRDYVDRDQPISVYRADVEGMRVALLSSCILCRGSGFELSVVDLSIFVQVASRGCMFVNIAGTGERRNSVKVPSAPIMQALGEELRPHIKKLLERANGVGSAVRARMLGDAAERFPSANTAPPSRKRAKARAQRSG